MTESANKIEAVETRALNAKVRQNCQLAAVELATALHLVHGLGVTIIDEVQEGSVLEDTLCDRFLESLEGLKKTFDKFCPKS